MDNREKGLLQHISSTYGLQLIERCPNSDTIVVSGDKKVLNILSSIITNNPDYNFNKVITTFKNELKDIENTLNENYSDFTKDCINIQITCGNDLIKKLIVLETEEVNPHWDLPFLFQYFPL